MYHIMTSIIHCSVHQANEPCDLKDTDFTNGVEQKNWNSRLLHRKLLMSGKEFPPFSVSLSADFSNSEKKFSTKSSLGTTGCQNQGLEVAKNYRLQLF